MRSSCSRRCGVGRDRAALDCTNRADQHSPRKPARYPVQHHRWRAGPVLPVHGERSPVRLLPGDVHGQVALHDLPPGVLAAYRPDIVHFQHTVHIGYDAISTVRRVLPETPIVYTLHEYLSICHRQGQMLRTPYKNEELCDRASPRRCSECFPRIPSSEFYLRERFIKAHLDDVDLFIAPSEFLLQRHVDWGIPPDRIMFEDYGRRPAVRLHRRRDGPAPEPLWLLRPVQPLQGSRDTAPGDGGIRRPAEIQLRLHGANLEQQSDEFRESFAALLERAEANVTMVGSYHPADVPSLMREIDWVLVPSRWWENSPLVIQEAFMQRRPVICTGIGGMAEKVTNEVNGLHFAASDPSSLAT